MTHSLPRFAVVAAADRNLGIGRGGRLPWRLPREMRYFRELTCGELDAWGRPDPDASPTAPAVVMGRRTWESIPAPYRPLRGRHNVVVTRDPDYPVPSEVLRAGDLEEGLERAGERAGAPREGAAGGARIFVIGGAEIYRRAVELPACESIYLTRIDADFGCDTHFPPIDERAYELASIVDEVTEGDLAYRIERWRRRAD